MRISHLNVEMKTKGSLGSFAPDAKATDCSFEAASSAGCGVAAAAAEPQKLPFGGGLAGGGGGTSAMYSCRRWRETI